MADFRRLSFDANQERLLLERKSVSYAQNLLTIVVAGMIAGSTSNIAFSKGRQHIRNARHVSIQQFRDAKTYVVPYYVSDPGSAYTGAAGAWATMTGFN
jgi:hypothetical protein